jgi:hypothetical protein
MKTKVYMIESEAGWGSKIDEVKEFSTKEKAVKFAEKYNKKYNNLDHAPSWYIKAVVESGAIRR